MSVTGGIIEVGLYDRLSNDSRVTDHVGTAIYPVLVPQVDDDDIVQAMPFVVYRRSGSNREYTFNGPTGLCEATIEIDSYAATYKKAKEIADAVRRTIDGFRGEWDGLTVDQVMLENDFDALEFPGGNEQIRAYRVTQIYAVHHRERLDT